MYQNPLYEEFNKEGYSFERLLANGNLIPKVFNNSNIEDYCELDSSITINGQFQIKPGPQCSEKTIKMLQRFVNLLNSTRFVDYDDTKEEKAEWNQ